DRMVTSCALPRPGPSASEHRRATAAHGLTARGSSVRRKATVDQTREQSARVTRRVDEFVGEQIRKRRTMLGLTQDQLAQALGISYQQVQKYETGTNRVSAGRLYDISRVLDSGVGAFFDGIEPDRAGGDEEGADRGNRATIELVRNFQAIGDPQI